MLRATVTRRQVSYRTTVKISEAFHNVVNRTNLAYDHVAIDVGSIAAQAQRVTKDLLGSERDAECIRFVHKTIGTIQRRIQAKTSLFFALDGSDPLWKIRRTRVHPGKKFEGRFYRSAASPMVYALEDKLRISVGESVKTSPNASAEYRKNHLKEFLISGAATMGPVEAKFSQWMLDLASRADVSRNDSICLVGGADLFLSALGAVPFHNVTTMILVNNDLKAMTVQDTFEWLDLEHVFSAATASGADGSGSANDVPALAELAQRRTDVVLLVLLSSGLSATDLSGVPTVAQQDVLGAYMDLFRANRSFALTTDDGPHGTVRLHCGALADVLQRATRKTGVPRPCPVSSDYLEILLQTHAMLCTGGIPNYRFIPRASEPGAVLDKPPSVVVSSLIGHLRHLSARPSANASNNNSDNGGTISPSIDRTFGLTGAEALLLGSPNAQLIEQIFPLFGNGHALPESTVQDLVGTQDVEEALEKAKRITDRIMTTTMTQQQPHDGFGGQLTAPHRATAHHPTHYWFCAAGSQGPPSGFSYQSVALGVKSTAQNTRRRSVQDGTGASPSAEGIVVDKSAKGSVNTLACYQPATKSWIELPCAQSLGAEEDGGAGELTWEAPSTLRVVSWNVQFGRFSGATTPLGRPGIDWCTPTRYHALSYVLSQTDADVIAMQEVESPWCEFLCQQPWVQERYRLTTLPGGHSLTPWGVLILLHRRLSVERVVTDNVPGFSGHTSVMPSVVVKLSPTASVSISSFHLLAPYTENHVSNRLAQVGQLVHKLTQKQKAHRNTIALGDFNDVPAQMFTMPSELRFKDAWAQLHPESMAPGSKHGFTIDGEKNEYCAKIIETQFFGRPDRVLYASERLQPIECSLIGTKSLQAMLADDGGFSIPPSSTSTANVPAGGGPPPTPFPSYLYPSDHFGVMVEFQVV